MNKRSPKVSIFYWIALSLFVFETAMKIEKFGETVSFTYTPIHIIINSIVIAFFGWLCFRAGQSSSDKT